MKSLLLPLLALPLFLSGCYTTVSSHHPRRVAYVERDYHHRHHHRDYDNDRYDRYDRRSDRYDNDSRGRYYYKNGRRVYVNAGVYY